MVPGRRLGGGGEDLKLSLTFSAPQVHPTLGQSLL